MPKVPQSLPASNSQKRDSSENRGFLQLCASGAVMVMMTGATAGTGAGTGADGAAVPAGSLLADAPWVWASCMFFCCDAQVSKQCSRAASSPAMAVHCNQASADNGATGLNEFWPLAKVDMAPLAIKKRVNFRFIKASRAMWLDAFFWRAPNGIGTCRSSLPTTEYESLMDVRRGAGGGNKHRTAPLGLVNSVTAWVRCGSRSSRCSDRL